MENDSEGHRQRLRERFMQYGTDGFHDYEILELMLFYVYPRKDTKKIAKQVLSAFKNNLHDIFSAEPENLIRAGLSQTAAILISSLKKIFIYQQKKKIAGSDFIKSSTDVYDYLKYYYKNSKYEEFYVIFLNTANCIIKTECLFSGTTNESRIYIRNIVESCLNCHASQIIIAHNHPSGNLKASDSDLDITVKIRQALSYLEIKLLDHLIIGDDDFMSFKEMGYID
jgi:DNA repair protein RadC